MSTTLVAEAVESEVLEAGQRTLSELASEANREHDAGCVAATDALRHWIAAGERLIEARERCEGSWGEWVDASFSGSRATAGAFIRLATYRAHLEAKDEITNVNQALKYLRGLPESAPRGPRGGFTSADADGSLAPEARRLLDAGAPQQEVAALLGVSETTVWRWRDPTRAKAKRAQEARRRRARAKRDSEIERRQARDAAMKKVGGSVADAYSMIRRTAQAVDRAHKDATDREVGAALSAALSKLHHAEDEIVRALGVA